MILNNIVKCFVLGAVALCLSACVAKNVELSEQQKRMQRCDQYIDRERDACLRGETVTLEEYKDEFRAYEKSRAKEAKEKEAQIESFIEGQKVDKSEPQLQPKPLKKDDNKLEDGV